VAPVELVANGPGVWVKNITSRSRSEEVSRLGLANGQRVGLQSNRLSVFTDDAAG
jgi:hypothetical protein